MDIFHGEADYEVFSTLLRDAATRSGMEIHAYAFMRNHVHLLVTPRRIRSLEKAMHLVGFQYARYFNARYQRTGPIFEGRYRTTVVDPDRYWYACLRYVELNPVRAGIVSTPDAYAWTSYAAHAFNEADALLTPHPLFQALGTEAAERAACWRQACGEGLTNEDLSAIRNAVHRGGVLGTLRIDDEVDEAQQI